MKYIALLRGINVGGNNKVSMSQLKACFVKAGFRNTRTYINSGNVIFESDQESAARLVPICEELLVREFGFPISLALIDAATLKDALEHSPVWWGGNPGLKHNAIFVIPPATAAEVMAEVGQAKPEYEQVWAYKAIIFWSAPQKTFSRTRWSKIVGKKAYQSITIRNANTTKKLLELAIN